MQPSEQQNGIKNPQIANIFSLNPEEETLLYEMVATFSNQDFWPDSEQVRGTVLVTNRRIAFFDEEVDGYYINTLTWVKDSFIDFDEKMLYLTWRAESDGYDEKFWMSLEDEEILWNIHEQIHSLRLQQPLPSVISKLEEALGLIQKRELEKAVSFLKEIGKEDPLCHIVDLMRVRTLNEQGKSSQAVMYLARQIPYLLRYLPEVVFHEYIWYNWHEQSLRYLPSLEELQGDQSVRALLLRAIHARANQQTGEFVELLCSVFHAMAQQDESVYIQGYEKIIEIISIAEERNRDSIEKLMSAFHHSIDALYEDPMEASEQIQLLEAVAQAVRNPESFRFVPMLDLMSGLLHPEERMEPEFYSYLLLHHEKFSTLSKLSATSAKPLSAAAPEEWTLYEIYKMEDVWSAVSPLKEAAIQIKILFAKFRNRQVTYDQVLHQILKWRADQIAGSLRNHEVIIPDAYSLLQLMEIECLYAIGKREEALQAVERWREDKGYQIGTSFYPFGKHLASICDLWEAIILGDASGIMESLQAIPEEKPFLWLRQFGTIIGTALLKRQEDLSHDSTFVIEELKASLAEFQQVSRIGHTHLQLKEKMQGYQDFIQDQLAALESLKSGAAEVAVTVTEPEPQLQEKAPATSGGMFQKFLQMFQKRESDKSKQEEDDRIPEAEEWDDSARRYLKIALVGETSAGKTTLLNQLFATNIFFVTQEEATGVPTEIIKDVNARVEVWDKQGQRRKTLAIEPEWRLADGTTIKEEYVEQIREFIMSYTRVGSPELQWVERVKVFLPLKELPDDIMLIDSPGFNANEARSTIANRVVESSHISLFIMDARNALKGKELHVLRMVREEVGKMFVVLNKMDLVFGDDELDCDGESAAEETIERVRRDLARSLEVEQVIVYPVCSLAASEVQADARRYVENLWLLRDKIFTEAKDQQVDLFVDALAKESITLSHELTEIIRDKISEHRKQLAIVQASAPASYDMFEQEIQERSMNSYYRSRSQYIQSMNQTIDRSVQEGIDFFYEWLAAVDSADKLKKGVAAQAEAATNHIISQIEQARKRELDRMVKRIHDELVEMFEQLYANLPFASSVRQKDLLRSLPSLHQAKGNALDNHFRSIDYGDGLNLGSAIGATIGAVILGPLGALVGGFLGTLFGGKSLGDVKQEVYDTFLNSITDVENRIISFCNQDLNTSDMSSFVGSLQNVTQEQLRLYKATIEKETDRQTQKIAAVELDIVNMKMFFAKTRLTIQTLKKWRLFRKQNLV